MGKYTLRRDGKKNLSFTGNKLAEASNYILDGREQTRWTEYALYKTVSGKYVLSCERLTRWQGESNSCNVYICETVDDLISVLTENEDEETYISNLAKELLENAGLEEYLVEEI